MLDNQLIRTISIDPYNESLVYDPNYTSLSDEERRGKTWRKPNPKDHEPLNLSSMTRLDFKRLIHEVTEDHYPLTVFSKQEQQTS
jgi:hypothetical protein